MGYIIILRIFYAEYSCDALYFMRWPCIKDSKPAD